MTPALDLHGVSRRYAAVPVAVDNLSLAVAPGELLALLGPSGCGKTTTLRLIAGLERPDAGTIAIAGRAVAAPDAWVPPERRGVGLVFQDYALFPHLTVAQNVAFGLAHLDRRVSAQRVAAMLALAAITELADRYPAELSGGQQQRVAIARAVAPDPPLLLLDEPFSNLDAALRQQLRASVRQLVRAAGITTIIVTHDQQEALSTADRVAVMFAGRIAQLGRPQDLYLRPASAAIAGFLGDANLLPGHAAGERATCALGTLQLAPPRDGQVVVLVRPEQIAAIPSPGAPATVVDALFLGADTLLTIALADGSSVVARARSDAAPPLGATVAIAVSGPCIAFPA